MPEKTPARPSIPGKHGVHSKSAYDGGLVERSPSTSFGRQEILNPIEDIPEFSGTASEIGAQYREYYQGEYESFFQKNSAIEVDSERADQFYEFVKETVPRWLFEAEACFGNDLKKFLHLNFLDPSSFPDDVLGNWVVA